MHVPAAVIEELVQAWAGVMPDLALRLARLFGTSPGFWLNGQVVWELYRALRAPGAADLKDLRPITAGLGDAAR
jgi:addiction module HigA family antidote